MVTSWGENVNMEFIYTINPKDDLIYISEAGSIIAVNNTAADVVWEQSILWFPNKILKVNDTLVIGGMLPYLGTDSASPGIINIFAFDATTGVIVW